MASLRITNISENPIQIRELYIEIPPGQYVVTERPQWSLSSLTSLHDLMAAGKATVVVTYTPGEQQAIVQGLAFDIFVPFSGETEAGLVSYDETLNEPRISPFTDPHDGSVDNVQAAIDTLKSVVFGRSNPTHLYVSAINGDDNNSGTTPFSPLATLVEAERRLPPSITIETVIHIGRADLDGIATYELPTFRERKLYANLRIVGDGAGQPGEDGEPFTVLIAETASEAGTSQTQIVTTGLTPGALEGRTIRIKSGASQFATRTIASNTATTIVPARKFEGTGPPVAGDTFEVLETTIRYGIPDVANGGEHVLVINNGSPDTSASNRVLSPGFYLVNFRPVALSPTGACGFCIRGSNVIVLGLDQESTTTIQIRNEGSSLLFGFNSVDATRTIGVWDVSFDGYGDTGFPGTGNQTSLLGWGAGFCGANSSSSGQSFGGGMVDGFIVSDRGLVFRDAANFYLRGGRSVTLNTTVPLTITNGSRGFVIAESVLPYDFESLLTPTAAVRVQDNGKLGCAYMRFNVPTAGASALRAEQGGVIELNTGYTCTAVGGYGILSAWGGQVYGVGAVFAGLTGTLGDASVDNHSACAIISGLVSSGDMAVGSGRIVRY